MMRKQFTLFVTVILLFAVIGSAQSRKKRLNNAKAKTAQKVKPRSQMIVGSVISSGCRGGFSTTYDSSNNTISDSIRIDLDGCNGMSDVIIESGGKRYGVVIDQKGLSYFPGARLKITYLGIVPCDRDKGSTYDYKVTRNVPGTVELGIPCLNVTRFVSLVGRAVNSSSTKTDKNGFQAFFKEFCSAIQKRDRAALELMMSATFEFRSWASAVYVQPSVVFDSLDQVEGWNELEKSLATGTKPYKDSSPQTVTRVTNSNKNMVLFGLGSDGKWRWLRFLGV